jgi:hypothetical protein
MEGCGGNHPLPSLSFYLSPGIGSFHPYLAAMKTPSASFHSATPVSPSTAKREWLMTRRAGCKPPGSCCSLPSSVKDNAALASVWTPSRFSALPTKLSSRLPQSPELGESIWKRRILGFNFLFLIQIHQRWGWFFKIAVWFLFHFWKVHREREM